MNLFGSIAITVFPSMRIYQNHTDTQTVDTDIMTSPIVFSIVFILWQVFIFGHAITLYLRLLVVYLMQSVPIPIGSLTLSATKRVSVCAIPSSLAALAPVYV